MLESLEILLLIKIFASVEICDAFALLFGKLFGRRRIFPRLSPKKTGAGLLGGFLCGGAASYALAVLLLRLPPAAAAVR